MCCSLSFWELVNLHRFRDSRSLEPPSDDPPLICVAALDATFGTRPFTSRRSRRCLFPAWMRSAIEPPNPDDDLDRFPCECVCGSRRTHPRTKRPVRLGTVRHQSLRNRRPRRAPMHLFTQCRRLRPI
jgi:hypothetical protein